ncbi:MAG: hypothetical protein QOJ02_3666 [Acidobacteriota bacterium]|jgi:hypothetical protein|nr:hypothetical protein [Acidobacteriota bacterium]
MPRCFVIQPFDKGKFDKRYDSVFMPAISEAGLEPYRVDRDSSVDIPIDTIEKEIRDANICLADITTDNPNVWYELGYAIAYGKDVILVCSVERTTKFPFDVQHRNIIQYAPESPQDFIKLGSDITARMKALLKKQRDLQTVASMSPIKETEGLSAPEIVALVSIIEKAKVLSDYAFLDAVLEDMRNAGFTEIAGTLSIQSLVKKQMVQTGKTTMGTNICRMTEEGLNWLMSNQDKLKLEHDSK